jgi:hypothetical protein
VASNTRLSPPSWDGYSVRRERLREGDVVLVEALDDIGTYAEIENSAGRSERLYRGDLFLAVVGNRQSSKYLCGSVPPEGLGLTTEPTLHLLSNGGIVGECKQSPDYLGRPLPLRYHGALADANGTVNTIRRRAETPVVRLAPLVLVAASTTDAGKTTLASRLIASLAHDQGLAVAAAKLTGTGCLEDILQHRDAGARWIADFPDAGLPSTYTSAENYVPAVRSLLHGLAAHAPDILVAELGGDLAWANVPTLLGLPDIMSSVLALLVIPNDVLSAIGTQHLLRQWQLHAPVTWVTPPGSNPASFRLRMDEYVPGELIDSRNRGDIDALAARLAEQALARREGAHA